MNNAERDFRDAILSTKEIEAYVADRVYFQKAPQKTVAPYIVITRISTIRENYLDVRDCKPQIRFQLDLVGHDYATIKILARFISDRFGHFSDANNIRSCRIEAERDVYDHVTEYPRIMQDYIIIYHERNEHE